MFLKYKTNHYNKGEGFINVGYVSVKFILIIRGTPSPFIKLPYGVMVSTIGFGPVSFGSSPDKETWCSGQVG